MKLLFLALCFFSLAAGAGEGHSRLDGAISVGGINLNALSTGDVKMGSGTYFSVGAEKPFGNLPLFLVVNLNYYHSSGTLNYNYTSTTATYTASNVTYGLDDFGGSLGFRVKFLESLPVRPYLEGGGVGGYFQLSYDSSLKTPSLLALGTDYKTTDGALEFGGYGELGIEADVTNFIGVRAAYKYIDTTTTSLATLRKQNFHYCGSIFYGAVFIHF